MRIKKKDQNWRRYNAKTTQDDIECGQQQNLGQTNQLKKLNNAPARTSQSIDQYSKRVIYAQDNLELAKDIITHNTTKKKQKTRLLSSRQTHFHFHFFLHPLLCAEADCCALPINLQHREIHIRLLNHEKERINCCNSRLWNNHPDFTRIQQEKKTPNEAFCRVKEIFNCKKYSVSLPFWYTTLLYIDNRETSHFSGLYHFGRDCESHKNFPFYLLFLIIIIKWIKNLSPLKKKAHHQSISATLVTFSAIAFAYTREHCGKCNFHHFNFFKRRRITKFSRCRC